MTGPSRRTALRLGGAVLSSLSLTGCLGGHLSALAGTGPEIEWRRAYDYGHRDDGRSLIPTEDGGFAVAGEASTFETADTEKSSGAWVLRAHRDGTERWSETYGTAGIEESVEIVPASDGDGFVVGGWGGAGDSSSDIWLMRMSEDAEALWTRTYDNGGSEYLGSLTVAADGGYALAGSTSASGRGAGWLVETGADGGVEWSRTYAPTDLPEYGDAGLTKVVRADDGGYFLVGHASSGSESGFSWFGKTDAEGAVEWRARYGDAGKIHRTNDAVRTADGGFLAVGTTAGMGGWPWESDPDWAVKFDADGNRLWTHEETFRDPQAVATDDGGALLAGRRDGGLSTKRLDGAGEKRWDRGYPNAKVDLTESLVRIDGGYAVLGRQHVGNIGDYGLTDAVLVKLRE